MQKTKKIAFVTLAIVILLILLFILGEIITRIVIGNRLIVQVEENGLFHFKPNQEGWYTQKLGVPHARINNIWARGEDVNISLLNNTKKYIFLGDSFTFGWDLKDTQTIPYYFSKEANLKGSIAINYANGGFGIEHMIATYNFFKNNFRQGDTIIMVIVEDDFSRELIPYKHSSLKEAFWDIKEKSSLIAFIWANFRHISVSVQSPNDQSNNKDAFIKSQQKLLDFYTQLKKDKINLVYVFYEYNQTDYSEKAKDFCKKNKLLCITNIYDSIESVRKQKKDIYTIDSAHPSNNSNLALAKDIVNFIKTNKL